MKQNNKMTKYYWNAKIRMLITAVVIIGALNWGATAVGFNVVEKLSQIINQLLKSNIPFDKIIYIVVAVCGILLASNRTTWLPFLGTTVLPDSLLPLQKPEKSDTTITIKTKPNVKVAYWAALPKDEEPDVVSAYGDYSNGGVVMSDANGVATLPILSGSAYTVPSGRRIARHIHYRILGKPYGMMGKIKTKYY